VSRLRQEAGHTLVELLLAMSILTVVLGATLDTLDRFVSTNSTNQKQNDAQDRARLAMDRMAWQLRNVASPQAASVKSIYRATDYDLVFQTRDPVKRWVRYCLQDADKTNASLWMQTRSLAGPPDTTSCPAAVGGSGWATRTAVADNVVNTIDGEDRNVFYYAGLGADADTSKITGIRAQLFVDVNPGKKPDATEISSGDFLRNQNRTPSLPDFSLTQSPPGSRTYILNGSDASDPEGRTLDYFWYKGPAGGPTSLASLPDCLSAQTAGGYSCIGRGITQQYTFLAAETLPQSVTLKVVDPGGLAVGCTKNTNAASSHCSAVQP
jgi:type II secretory pathway pseudopilin PulG